MFSRSQRTRQEYHADRTSLNPTRVYTDKSSLFFTIAKSQIDYMKIIGLKGRNLHVYVTTPDGETIDYIKRPVLLRSNNIYKVVLPRKLFEEKVRPGDTVHVKITVTDKTEELYYTEPDELLHAPSSL